AGGGFDHRRPGPPGAALRRQLRVRLDQDDRVEAEVVVIGHLGGAVRTDVDDAPRGDAVVGEDLPQVHRPTAWVISASRTVQVCRSATSRIPAWLSRARWPGSSRSSSTTSASWSKSPKG